METKINEDLGEEIISRLKELIKILEGRVKNLENDEECPFTFSPRN